jgi:hypothetical protein
MSLRKAEIGCKHSLEAAEKVRLQRRTVPQRLKPRCKKSTYGTAEAVPLTKQEFSRSQLCPTTTLCPISRPQSVKPHAFVALTAGLKPSKQIHAHCVIHGACTCFEQRCPGFGQDG